MSINDRILSVRNALKMSQRAFGDAINITSSALSKLERGENNPSAQTIQLICSQFHVNSMWLKDGADVPMFLDDETDEDAILRILHGDDPWIRDMIIDLYHLPPECRDAVRTLCAHIRANRKESPEKE